MTQAQATEAMETAAEAPTLCANCSAPLVGRYCHRCSQDSHHRHRSIGHLAWEAVEGLTHFDGRLRNTLPDLFFRPGRLARDYVDGRVARHMPPFRTFLVALLIFLFAAEVAVHRNTVAHEREEHARELRLQTPQGRAEEAAKLRAQAARDHADDLKDAADERADGLKDPDEKPQRVAAIYAKAVAASDARYALAMAKADRAEKGLPEPPKPPETRKSWWRQGLRKATDNPEYFWTVLFGWGHRLAVLLLPVVGLTLAAVYRNRPEIFLYDHLQVAMNLMSFTFLTNAVGLLLPTPALWWWLAAVALWTPVNLFQTLRGGYGSTLLGAGAKALVVWLTSVAAFTLLLFGLILFSLTQL